MQKPRFDYELKHYNGRFFHDVAWLPVEVCRALNAMGVFTVAAFVYRIRELVSARPPDQR